jgi:hypothetical protein
LLPFRGTGGSPVLADPPPPQVSPAGPKKNPPGDKLSFNRDIRPILVENCFACHGPDSASRKAGLRLDQRELAVKAGAITPGKPEESDLVRRIFAEPDDRMPPLKSTKKLTDQQKDLLHRWVAEGAEYQPHWSYIAPVRPELPKVKKADWVRNPIDAFVLAKLEELGLEPSPEADRRALARRLSFDLTGLPPDPKEVEAFVNDAKPQAYERLVDRWLELPQYGEHRARYWLDAARYADTHGLHFDNVREMWAYRDWVITAFNRNQPFDQFTIDQLAGDLVQKPSLDQLVASGFHRCNITTNEGGSIAEEVLVMYAKDRVETTATVWLGLTAGCASCHDHKFDALPTKDFYQFAAFFRNTTQPAMDGNVANSAPVISVPGMEDRPRWLELLKLTGDLRADLERRRLETETKMADWLKSGAGRKFSDPLDPTSEILNVPDVRFGNILLRREKALDHLYAKYNPLLQEKTKELQKLKEKFKGATEENQKRLYGQLEKLIQDLLNAKSKIETVTVEIKLLKEESTKATLEEEKIKLANSLKEAKTRFESLEKKVKEFEEAVDKKIQEVKLDAEALVALKFVEKEIAQSQEILAKVAASQQDARKATQDARKDVAGKVLLRLNGKEGFVKLPPGLKWDFGAATGNDELQFEDNQPLTIPGLDDFDASKSFTLTGWIKAPANNCVIASRFDQPDKKDSPGWQLDTRTNRLAFTLRTAGKEQLLVTSADVFPAQKWTHMAVTYNGSGLKSGLVLYINGKAQNSGVEAAIPKEKSLKTKAPLRLGAENFKGGALHDFRIYSNRLTPDEITLLSKWASIRPLLDGDGSKLTAEQRKDLALLHSLRFDPAYAKAAEQLAVLTKEQDAIRSRNVSTHIMQEKPGSMPVAKILYRGQYDMPKEEVKAGVFSILNPLPKDAPTNRLGLAQWLVARDNPLTARVTVNRFWQEIFGDGLVRTSGDFGVSGELPSHPELLDWLAVEFMEPTKPAGFGVPRPAAWDVKRLMRLMLTSATYRQSAHVTKDRLEKDPHNTYLSRGPRFRMDAEMIRDNALAVSGLLVKKIGGPSVKPYQPDGVWDAVAMRESNTRDYKQDKGESLYRRGMYTFWKRAAPPPAMDILNAPSREYCTVRRERTNTPLQALVTLNDPQFVEAARHLAQLAIKEGGDKVEDRIDFMARRLLSRPFRPAELKVVRESLDDLLAHYKDHVPDAQKLLAVGESRADAKLDVPTLAAWTMLANELLNLDEVLNK